MKIIGIPSIFQRYALVKKISIFSKLNFIDLQKIARWAEVEEYQKGELICKQGDAPESFYCLISGRLRAFSTDSNNKKYNVEFIRRGMHFGIVSLLTNENHAQTCEVFNDAIILKFEKERFQKILKSFPQLSVELSRSLSKKIYNRASQTKSTFESKIISIYSPIKNSGASTYAINLALSLKRETRKKIVYINITENIASKSIETAESKETTPQWKKPGININNISNDYEKIIENIFKTDSSIDLLNITFDRNQDDTFTQINQCVTVLVNDYDYIVADLPSGMDTVVLKTLTQSDIIQLITLDREDHLTTTRDTVYRLEEEMSEHFEQEKIHVILSDREHVFNPSFEIVNTLVDFDVYTRLPYISFEELHAAEISNEMSLFTPAQKSAYTMMVKKIAREISKVSVGLVLGGGVALGIAHIGVLRVLEQEKIPIDIIVGSSIGALLATFWAIGKNTDEMEDLAKEFQKKEAILKIFDPIIPIAGFVGGRSIARWLKNRGLKDKTFYNTTIPLKIVAYDLIHRQEIVINSGSLVEAVRKSIAIPGIFKPILEKDKMIIDGGVMNPLPTNVLKDLGIKKIIAVNVLLSPEHASEGYLTQQQNLRTISKIPFHQSPWRYIQFRLTQFMKKIFMPNIADIIVQSLQASEYLIAKQSAHDANIVIHPNLAGINWFELHKVDELIKSGEDAARKALPAIKQLVEE